MPVDRSPLEEHIKNLLDATESELEGAEWTIGNACTVVEIRMPVDGEELAFQVEVRTRHRGDPIKVLGLLSIARATVMESMEKGAE